MRKPYVVLLVVVFLGISCCGGLYYLVSRDSPELANYNRIQVGMSADEVEAILGPGTVADPSEIPGIEEFVNPADADAAHDRFKKMGPNATTKVRGYPMRIKPVVAGDTILKWETRDAEILVAFKNGKVCEKYFHDLNYL